jgi:tyrosyl-tRNA synthetase
MIFVSSLATLFTKVYPDSCLLVTPQILKSAVSAALNTLLAPIQEAYHASPEWQDIALKAYPPPAKKEKKVKQKGSQYPTRLKNENIKASGSEGTS